ncbi:MULTISPECIES: hypothetical protein [unclassified Caballeronia]|uniref:hypothetical protein n=1 Tax=unclassified Caballeronia TaxID=2646786 RepID=UPI002856F1CC|nr:MULTISPECIES: hypothetical protein [unclassified Caballeronia]MDR5738868.1 hypothetical protein [Caballeronia sp. LZ016]MDR5811265.1 hypothetical protein [Caballeronia sp. LZ019]
MTDLTSILVGIAGLAALGIVLFAQDWRMDDRRREPMHARARRHPLRDWWLRHRH